MQRHIQGLAAATAIFWLMPSPSLAQETLLPSSLARDTNQTLRWINRSTESVHASCDDRPQKPQNAKSCHAYYDKMFESGTVNWGVALGYLDPVADYGYSSKARYETIIQNLTRPCGGAVKFACGFKKRNLAGLGVLENDLAALSKSFDYITSTGQRKTVTMQMQICHPTNTHPQKSSDPTVQRQQQEACTGIFRNSLKSDHVSIYLGHSMYGTGPSFSAPVIKKIKRFLGKGKPTIEETVVDSDYYHNLKRHHANPFFSQDTFKPESGETAPPLKQVYMLSCASNNHFRSMVRSQAEAAGYNQKNFLFAGVTAKKTSIDKTENNSEEESPGNPLAYLDGTEVPRLVEAFGTGGCENDLTRAYSNRDDERFPTADLPDAPIMIIPQNQAELVFDSGALR